MKIKVFEFEVSNASSSVFEDDEGQYWYAKARAKLSTPEMIEDTLNEFMENHIIDFVKANTVDVHYHNNGRGNTVKLIYTLGYSGKWKHD